MAKRKKQQSSGRNTAAARKSTRPYPGRTLEESLKIPQAIREKNNGNPRAVEDVAQAAHSIKPSNNKFFYLAAAARDYGFTIGTRYTEKIELAPLGREIVFAGDEPSRARVPFEYAPVRIRP